MTIVLQFADGMAYSKGKLEEAFRPGGILDKPVKQPKETFSIKREDVDLIVRVHFFGEKGIASYSRAGSRARDPTSTSRESIGDTWWRRSENINSSNLVNKASYAIDTSL